MFNVNEKTDKKTKQNKQQQTKQNKTKQPKTNKNDALKTFYLKLYGVGRKRRQRRKQASKSHLFTVRPSVVKSTQIPHCWV